MKCEKKSRRAIQIIASDIYFRPVIMTRKAMQAWESNARPMYQNRNTKTRRTTAIYPANLREFFTLFPIRPSLEIRSSTLTDIAPYRQGLTWFIRVRGFVPLDVQAQAQVGLNPGRLWDP